jgi:hypothetical protein
MGVVRMTTKKEDECRPCPLRGRGPGVVNNEATPNSSVFSNKLSDDRITWPCIWADEPIEPEVPIEKPSRGEVTDAKARITAAIKKKGPLTAKECRSRGYGKRTTRAALHELQAEGRITLTTGRRYMLTGRQQP